MQRPSYTDFQLSTVNSLLEESWKEILSSELQKPYFDAITAQLRKEAKERLVVYPAPSHLFEAFAKTPFEAVKVIILGQDPYHNPGQAMGLSFSVPQGVRVPPSLRNIYKELVTDQAFEIPSHGDLTSWADQGVFLLNTILTVREKTPKSHKKLGWHFFTDAVINVLSTEREGLIFMLWGNAARAKADLIDSSKHLILEAAHPSPLARGAYFGSKHFSKANAYFKANGQSEIDWSIPA